MSQVLKVAVIAGFAGFALTSNAEVIQMNFVDATGKQKVVSGSTEYLNNKSAITVTSSSGIDRKVRVSLLKASNSQVLATATSPLLDASSKQSVGGKEYYAANNVLNVLAEGNYLLKEEILTSADKVLSTTTSPLTIDTTPPSTGEIVWDIPYPAEHIKKQYEIPVFANQGGKYIKVSDVIDASGVASSTYKISFADGVNAGKIYSSGNAEYQSTTNSVLIGGANAYDVGKFQMNNGGGAKNRVVFSISDKAGNSIDRTLDFYNISNLCKNVPKLVAYEDKTFNGSYLNTPSLKGYKEVVGNFNVPANPAKFLYKIDKDKIIHEEAGKLYGGYVTYEDNINKDITNIVYRDNDSVYLEIEGVVKDNGTIGHGSIRWRNHGQTVCSYGFNAAEAKLTADTSPPPGFTTKFMIDGLGYKEITFRSTMPGVPSDTKVSKVLVETTAVNYDRTYELGQGGVTCQITSGKTSCEAPYDIPFNTTGTTGSINYHHLMKKSDNPDLFLKQNYVVLAWNNEPPVFKRMVSHASDTKTVVFEATKNKIAANHETVKLENAGLKFVNKSGVETVISKSSVAASDGLFVFTANYESLAAGEYQVYAWLEDSYSNYVLSPMLFNFVNDTKAPTVKISSKSASVSSLDEITIALSDDLTNKPKITEINLKGGPAKDNVYLTSRNVSGNNYSLEYPVMFPSLVEGESYTLTVKAIDDQNNIGSSIYTFKYEPRQVTLAGSDDGNIELPAVREYFSRANGKSVIESNPLTLINGSPVSGAYDVYVTSRTDSTVPVEINGVDVAPGQTQKVSSLYNFSETAGKIALPIKYKGNGAAGNASLLISSSAPNAPIILANVRFWNPAVQLSTASWNVRQGIDLFNIQASPIAGTKCGVRINEEKVRSADAVTSPLCLIEFDKKPEGDTNLIETSTTTATLQGRAYKLGANPLSYKLFMFNAAGAKIQVGSGTGSMNVGTASGSVTYATAQDLSTVSYVIAPVETRMKSLGDNSCAVTTSQDKSIQEGANRQSYQQGISCYFEWTKLPPGMQQVEDTDQPYIRGTVNSKGAHPLAWTISMFSKTGQKVILNSQTNTVNAVDPEKPNIELTSKFFVTGSDTDLVIPMDGGYLGDIKVSAARTNLNLKIGRGSQIVEDGIIEPVLSNTNVLYRRVEADQRGLWEKVLYVVDAKYSLLPSFGLKKTFNVYASPGIGVKPVVILKSDKAVDTEPLKVTVQIMDRSKPSSTFTKETMGNWKVRLVRVMTYNKREPLTDYVNITPTGEAHFDVSVAKLDSSALRFVAEAVLETPVAGYERIEESSTPGFVSIVRGGEIPTTITTRKLSGEAPYANSFKLGVDDRLDMQAVGDVVWETSTNGGANWSAHTTSKTQRFQFSSVFEKGTHLVRANVTNVNSGKSKYAEPVQVVVYDKPKLSLTGAQAFFAGATAKINASLMLGDAAFNPKDAVIEWSTDNGETFVAGGTEYSVAQADVARVRLVARARSNETPADDAAGYSVVRKTLDFMPVKAPRPHVTGPNRLEKGKTYTLDARVTAPYRDMDAVMKGAFTMPDGSVIEGLSAQYTPSEADLAAQTVAVKYTAWVEGFRDRGSEASYTFTTKVWEYVWPSFGMELRRTAKVAPADVTVIVRPIAFNGTLEQPTYTWSLPQSAVVIDAAKPTQRSFTVPTDGVFDISVTIRDARGNETVVKQDLAIGVSVPYKVDLQYSASNPINRAPLDVLLRPYVSGGHTLDRIDTRSFAVNGEKLEVAGHYGRVTLNAGEHDVVFSIRSKMGEEAESKVRINVKENMVPTCDITTRETVGSWVFYASCKDDDGRMKSYEWMVNQEVKGVSGDRITINRTADTPRPQITLVGIDDAGGRSQPVSAP